MNFHLIFSSENRTLINADGADKNKNQRNLRPFSFMIVRRGAWGLFVKNGLTSR
jgi:hypothetical protein